MKDILFFMICSPLQIQDDDMGKHVACMRKNKLNRSVWTRIMSWEHGNEPSGSIKCGELPEVYGRISL